ncbi:glycosyltransferase family 4 protein [Streptacidiphilus cavernicola]|uniref:Glycosyltransferase family 4 protein n=1 Tax=Streptacidiphilus cavernicola TaxID=3342716 RepID=A0ABV6VVY0_9ACTN
MADLTDTLVSRGHHVTVFASGDSKVVGELHSCHPVSLNADPELAEPEVARMLQLAEVRDRADEFDVIHNHIHSNSGCSGLPGLAGLPTPVLHTVHCFFNRDNTALFQRYREERFVAVSHHQRSTLPELNYQGVVHHGLELQRFPHRADADSDGRPFLVFLGRIRPEKGVHKAIEIAYRSGLPLKIAGRVKARDAAYFAQAVEPHLDGDHVEYLGELGFGDKTRLLAQAQATLVTSQIPEPFGLVTLESLACGTPVVALPTGATPELVQDGVTGFLRPTTPELALGAVQAAALDPAACRAAVADRFSTARMTEQYLHVYAQAAGTSAR